MLLPLIVHHAKAFVADIVTNFKDVGTRVGHKLSRTQSGFVTLLRPYALYPAGQVVELPKSTEDALIAAGQAITSAGPATAGAVTTNATSGSVTIAAGASSVVVTNPLVTVQSVIFAVIAQAAADATLLRVERVVPAAGSFTIFGTANATANTVIDWAIIPPVGLASFPS
jgi:hypothetical protein